MLINREFIRYIQIIINLCFWYKNSRNYTNTFGYIKQKKKLLYIIWKKIIINQKIIIKNLSWYNISIKKINVLWKNKK